MLVSPQRIAGQLPATDNENAEIQGTISSLTALETRQIGAVLLLLTASPPNANWFQRCLAFEELSHRFQATRAFHLEIAPFPSNTRTVLGQFEFKDGAPKPVSSRHASIKLACVTVGRAGAGHAEALKAECALVCALRDVRNEPKGASGAPSSIRRPLGTAQGIYKRKSSPLTSVPYHKPA